MKGGPRKTGFEESHPEDRGTSRLSERGSPDPAGPGFDPGLVYRELDELRGLRARQEAELDSIRRMARELLEQVRRGEHLREHQDEVQARSLEQVEALRARLDGEFSQRIESLVSAFEESRRSHRQSSSTVASVVRRLEGRLQEINGSAPGGGAPEALGPDPRVDLLCQRLDEVSATLSDLVSLPSRLGAVEAGLGQAVAPQDLEARLEALESLPSRLGAVEAGLGQAVAPQDLEARLEALESLPSRLGAVEAGLGQAVAPQDLEARLEALESLPSRLGAVEAGLGQAVGPQDLLARLEALESLPARLEALEASRSQKSHGKSQVAPEVLARLEALEALSARSETPEAPIAADGVRSRLEALESLPDRLEALAAAQGEVPLGTELSARLQALEMMLARQQALESLPARMEALESTRGAVPAGTEISTRLQAVEAALANLEGLEPLTVRLQELEAAQGQVPAGTEIFSRLQNLEGLLPNLQTLDSVAARLEGLESGQGDVPLGTELSARLQALETLFARLQAVEALPARVHALESTQGEVAMGTELSARLQALETLFPRLQVLEALPARLQSLETQVSPEAIDRRLKRTVAALEERLNSTASGRLEQALAEAIQPLEERIESLPEEVQGMVDGLDFTGLTKPLIARLDALADELNKLRRKASDARLVARLDALEAQGTEGRLVRLEKDVRSYAERLDEELAAVFEQNRLRVAEMTDTFHERMATLEEAAERVRELEEATTRSRAETGHVLHAAFERMESLTGKLGRLEDKLSSAPSAPATEDLHELRGAVTHLENRMHFLEASPRHLVPAAPKSRQITYSDSFSAGEDPEEGLAPADIRGLSYGPSGQVLPIPGALGPSAANLEKMVQDVELRLAEQSLEALAESRLLREEYERIRTHLSDLSENLNQHFEAIWDRLERL